MIDIHDKSLDLKIIAHLTCLFVKKTYQLQIKTVKIWTDKDILFRVNDFFTFVDQARDSALQNLT